jgi:hypothetical protein
MIKLQACPHCFQPISDEDEVCPLCQEPIERQDEERRWRIPCPNGHLFTAPDSWLGREMVCPKCNEQFTLSLFNSLEKREERRLVQEARDAKAAKRWLNSAIWALIFTIFFISSLVIFSQAR